MRRALELLIVVAALFLGGYVALRLGRRAPPASIEPALLPAGIDQEDPRKPSGPPDSPVVQAVPMIKLSHPPQRRPRGLAVPAPSVP